MADVNVGPATFAPKTKVKLHPRTNDFAERETSKAVKTQQAAQDGAVRFKGVEAGGYWASDGDRWVRIDSTEIGDTVPQVGSTPAGPQARAASGPTVTTGTRSTATVKARSPERTGQYTPANKARTKKVQQKQNKISSRTKDSARRGEARTSTRQGDKARKTKGTQTKDSAREPQGGRKDTKPPSKSAQVVEGVGEKAE
jgi:hypothetical protein